MDGTRSAAGRIAASRCHIVLVWFLAFCPLNVLAQQPQPPKERVARLIRDLGSSDFATRDRAGKELSMLGGQTREQLEAALASPDVEVRLRARRLLDELKLEDLWHATTVQYEAKGEPASKVLAALANQAGNHIHIGDPYGNFSDKKLDVKLGPTSYWQAVDEICVRTENRMRPHYDMHTPGIVVSAGTPPEYPRAYGGPVRGEITGARRVFIEELDYEDHQAELTHSFQVKLRFSWEDRFAVVGYATQPELVEAVTDNHVVCSAAQPAGGGWNATSPGLRQVTASIKLNPVPISAKTFETFTIRWGLIAVGEPSVLEIDPSTADKRFAQDDVAARVVSIKKQPGAKITVTLNVKRDLTMPEPNEVVFQEYRLEMFDTDGRRFRVQSQRPSLSDRGVELKYSFAGESPDSEPKMLKLHYPRLRARRQLELSFKNVPLPTARPE